MCTVYLCVESEEVYYVHACREFRCVPMCRELRFVLCTWLERVKVSTMSLFAEI